MSNASTLGQPIPIVIGGMNVRLHPLSIYEIGIAESFYVSKVRREALQSTLGIPAERESALLAAADHIAELDTDASPVTEWIMGSFEGLTIALASCMEGPAGWTPSHRDVGRWYMENGGQNDGSPVQQWLIASRLRSDPTEGGERPPTNPTPSSTDGPDGSKPSIEPSLVG